MLGITGPLSIRCFIILTVFGLFTCIGNAGEGLLSLDFKLRSTSGEIIDPLKPKKTKENFNGFVFIFTLTDCPIANSYSPEISRISKEYREKGFDLYLIQTNPNLKIEDAKKHQKEYSLDIEVLLDPHHKLVSVCKAENVPEVIVLSPEKKILYKGRINDRNTAYGKRRRQPSRHDLRLALESIFNKTPVEISRTKVIGCYIPPLPKI